MIAFYCYIDVGIRRNGDCISELERLLGTATDQERKEMIKKALSALDASESAAPATNGATNFIQSLHPSAHAHLFAKVRHSGLCINVGPLM
jgi:hypothetical protein